MTTNSFKVYKFYKDDDRFSHTETPTHVFVREDMRTFRDKYCERIDKDTLSGWGIYDVHYTQLDKAATERDRQLLSEVCEELGIKIQGHGPMNSFDLIDLMRMRWRLFVNWYLRYMRKFRITKSVTLLWSFRRANSYFVDTPMGIDVNGRIDGSGKYHGWEVGGNKIDAFLRNDGGDIDDKSIVKVGIDLIFFD